MKTILLILAAASTSMYSQIFISAKAGASIPTGDFSSKDEKNINSSCANTGFYSALEAGYMFSKIIGVQASFNYTSNQVDKAAYEKKIRYSDIQRGGTKLIGTLDNGFNYTSTTPMVGLVINIPIQKSSVFLKGNLGYMSFKIPEHSYISTYNVFEYTYSYPEVSVSKMVYNAELGYRYNFTDNLSIGASASFLSASFKNYSYTKTVSTKMSGSAFDSYSRTITETTNFSSILTGLVVQFKF